jgi:hypothetical protein
MVDFTAPVAASPPFRALPAWDMQWDTGVEKETNTGVADAF